MLSSTEIKWLTTSEQTEYKNLIATNPQNVTILEEKKKALASILLKIDELTAINLNLDAERAKLNKTYNDIMLQRQLIKEAEEKRLLELERIKFEENKRLQEAEILRLELEKRKFDEERRLFESSKSNAVINPTVTSVEPKKSNVGMILGVAALGVGAYLYTKE